MMRRRKHNSRSSEYHGEVNITNSEDQNDETLIWTNVNLNSSTRNYNTFSQIFGAGKIKVLFWGADIWKKLLYLTPWFTNNAMHV